MKRLYLAALASLALTAPAEAARPTYSYLEAAYLHNQSDNRSNEAQGPRVNFNVSLARWVYFAGEVDRLEFNSSDTTSTAASLGFGVHSLKSTFQLFATGSYERRNVDFSGVPDSKDEGYGAQLGFRLPIFFMELQGDYKYLDFGDLPNGESDDDNRYRAILQARLTDTTALTASWETFEQSKVEQWTAGLRFYFKTQYDVSSRKKRGAPAAPAAPGSAQQEAETQ